MFTREELNQLGTCIDLVIKQGGVNAAKTLLPLFEKVEGVAKEMDTQQQVPKPDGCVG